MFQSSHMKRIVFLICLFLVFIIPPLKAQFRNILIGHQREPEEVTICINPKNPLQVAAAANIDNYYYSKDGGENWSWHVLSNPETGVYGDPIIIADTTGNFYYFHLSNPPPGKGSWVDRMVCQRSRDGGMTYDQGSTVGQNAKKVQDKPGATVNPYTNEIYLSWTQFDSYASKNAMDSTIILFSKSRDNARTWSSPKRISKQGGDCLDSDNTVEGAVPCTGPRNQIYIAWAGPDGLVFNKSLDGGTTWMPAEKKVCAIPGGWDYPIPGLERCNGLPVTVCDLSHGPNRGTIYINWSDQRNGSGDTDIWMVKSSDEGDTWSSPIRVNDDAPGKHQFMSWMCLDQLNGNICILFYDRRAYPSESLRTDVYMAVSGDGGRNFYNYKINAESFVPDPRIFFGDYISVSAVNNHIRPIWMSRGKNELSVWTAIIESSDLDLSKAFRFRELPDLFVKTAENDELSGANINFVLRKKEAVKLELFDMSGNKIRTIYSGEVLDQGSHRVSGAWGLAPGIYYYLLECGEGKQANRLTITE